MGGPAPAAAQQTPYFADPFAAAGNLGTPGYGAQQPQQHYQPPSSVGFQPEYSSYPAGGDYADFNQVPPPQQQQQQAPQQQQFQPQYQPTPPLQQQQPMMSPAGPGAPPQLFNPNAPLGMFQQPIVQDMAMQYGQRLADQGKQLVESNFEKYVPVTRLKYYFAVDNNYVLNKLRLLFFPFTHTVSGGGLRFGCDK